jgi:hypothetical protein
MNGAYFGILNSFPLDNPCAGPSMAMIVLPDFFKYGSKVSQRDALLSQPCQKNYGIISLP